MFHNGMMKWVLKSFGVTFYTGDGLTGLGKTKKGPNGIIPYPDRKGGFSSKGWGTPKGLGKNRFLIIPENGGKMFLSMQANWGPTHTGENGVQGSQGVLKDL